MATLTYSGTLTIVTCWCGMTHAIPAELHRAQERDPNQQAFCPVGHSYIRGGKSKAERELEQVRRQLEDEQTRIVRERAARIRAEGEAQSERRRAAAARGQLTKARNRAAKGVCPAPGCKRSFVDVARHVTTCHPEMASTEVSVDA